MQQYEKAISAGEKSLATAPDAIEVLYNNLKAAEAMNDADAVMKWSAETSRAARKQLAGSQQGAIDQSHVDYAKQVDCRLRNFYLNFFQVVFRPMAGASCHQRPG